MTPLQIRKSLASVHIRQGQLFPENTSAVVKFVESKLRQHNLVIADLLGVGTQGVAYSLTDGRVLKITADRTEAFAAAALRQKRHKHVYNVFSVFTMVDKNPDTKKNVEDSMPPIWFIICEKLKPAGISNDDLQDAGYLPTTDDVESLYPAVKENPKDFKKPLRDVVFGLKELDDMGIAYHDVHKGNVMKRGADYVIIDIGYSSSPGGKIDIVEAFKHGWKIQSYNQSYNILTVTKNGVSKEIQNVSPYIYEKIKKGKIDVSKYIPEGKKAMKKEIEKSIKPLLESITKSKPLAERKEISSVLEKIIQQIYQSKTVQEAKQLMRDYIMNSNIKNVDKLRMTQRLDAINSLDRIKYFATNAMLKFEGLGLANEGEEISKKSLKPLIESIVKKSPKTNK